jgi:adenylate cyclase
LRHEERLPLKTMLSQKTKRNIYRIIPFGIIWVTFSIVYTFLEKGLLGSLDHYPLTGNPYTFRGNIVITPIAALVTGLLIGAIEILYFNKLFSKKSFTKKIIFKSAIYLAIIISFLLIVTVFGNAVAQQTSIFDKQVWGYVRSFFSDYAFLSVGLYMASVIVISQFYTEVSENIGLGVLNNFFTGKYHSPKEEARIFMFLDMKSSTTIAESLGHIRYFEMLREYYSDLSDSIVKYSGEIYQYVGDEIVVSWTLKNGLNNNNCIQCFFAMRTALSKQAARYNERFGVLPEFKAGFHFGKVTTGEIGKIKKEIIFTGDVLNTTARIQGLCNDYKVDLLISDELMSQLDPDPAFRVTTLGETLLKGRDKKIELYTLLQNK